SLAQNPPSIVSVNPADKSWHIPINTQITIQFSETMDKGSVEDSFCLEDEYGQEIEGTFEWSSTDKTDDTVTFTPSSPLRYATHYQIEVNGRSADGHPLDGYGKQHEYYFITKPRVSDATPPTVVSVYPYDGMTNVSTTVEILCVFSEALDPDSVNTGTITLAGDGISGPDDYSVTYDYGIGIVRIRKNTALSANQQYTVTITTGVRDLRGNWLKEQYQWSFTTGAADTTAPTVVQTIPASGDANVSTYPHIYAIFSEYMERGTFVADNVTLYDDTGGYAVDIAVRTPVDYDDEYGKFDYMEIVPAYGTELVPGHQYTVTISGVADLAQNDLGSYSWSFTVAGSGVDQDPVLLDGIGPYDQISTRYPYGTSYLDLEVGAHDDNTWPLTVSASSSIASYTLDCEGLTEYEYESEHDEGYSPGTHTLSFLVQDGAGNSVSYSRDIFVFDAVPTLNSPSDEATGISTTPTLQWSYSGSLHPWYYQVMVLDGPDPDMAEIVWSTYVGDDNSGTYSASIPEDKALAPLRTYYWYVRGFDFYGNGVTISDMWSFTTGGTPPPEPSFRWVIVRSDDRIWGMYTDVGARVIGPSPADIKELKVTGPDGFTYFFSEDDIIQSEVTGLFFWHAISGVLPDGLYTFTVTDRMGRTATAYIDFYYTSVPRVEASTMSPADNSYVNTTTPTLSWGSVGTGYYYRVMVFSWTRNNILVYKSHWSTATSIQIPSGYLKPNTPYRWRVEVADSPEGKNRSVSEYRHFSTGPPPTDPEYNCDIVWGLVWNSNNYYVGEVRKALGVNIKGPTPTDVAQLSVNGPNGYTYDFTDDDLWFVVGLEGSLYFHGEPYSSDLGDYVFNLQDSQSNTDSYTKTRTSNEEIPVVDRDTFYPPNNAYLHTLTPTFHWGSVSGENRYYRILVTDWMGKYTVYTSRRSPRTWAKIPEGVLRPNASYRWRVDVFDNSSGVAADNRSTSGWYFFTTPSEGYAILHRDGAVWFSDTGWDLSAYYPFSDFAVDMEYGASGPVYILHRDGAVWNSDTGWDLNTPPYYADSDYARDLEFKPSGSYTILHKKGALWNSVSGWFTDTPPYYPDSDYARDMEYRNDEAYVILHKDGAVYDSGSGWNTNTPPYYPGSSYARDLEFRADEVNYVILHKDGALWSTDGGWVLDQPPYYA
ncbi:MAG: hypothetical protein DRN28_07000, partial [Thermoplasmata archaeon]